MNDIKIDTLGYFVDRTFTNMVKFLNYELSALKLELQHPQFTIMMVLSQKDGISQSTIRSVVDRDKASVSRNLRYLEEIGYIKRTLKDGKKKLLYLTKKGKEIIPILYKVAESVTDTSLKGFSADEKKSVFEVLEKMYLNLVPVTNR